MGTRSKTSVAIIGEFFIDEIFAEFGGLPRLGEERFARAFRREAGGGAAITACALAKLGVPVLVFGVLGKADGPWVRDRLISCGVDCSGLELVSRKPTGITVSASTREDRAFLTYNGANAELTRLLQQPSTAEILGASRHVHFACAPDGETDVGLFRTLRRHTRISIDVQSHVSWLTRPESMNILRQCDVFFPNEREGGWISSALEPHDILLRLRDKGLRGVGLKLGGKGAALLWRGRQFLADCFPVKTLDTTGAGDCFNAGFIFSWLRGDPPQRRLQVANICGALSTRALGGIDGFPSLQELSDYESKLKVKNTKSEK